MSKVKVKVLSCAFIELCQKVHMAAKHEALNINDAWRGWLMNERGSDSVLDSAWCPQIPFIFKLHETA